MELTKSGKKILYYSNNSECDFLLMENEKVCEAIQICFDINDADKKNREEKGLINICREFQLKRGLILTIYDEQKYTVDGITIEIMPVYKYLLKKYIA